jgi:hypothetical protein
MGNKPSTNPGAGLIHPKQRSLFAYNDIYFKYYIYPTYTYNKDEITLEDTLCSIRKHLVSNQQVCIDIPKKKKYRKRVKPKKIPVNLSFDNEKQLNDDLSLCVEKHIDEPKEILPFNKEKQPDDVNFTVCVVCLDKPRDTLIVDCKHLVLCQECLTSISQCPICRCQIKTTINVFMT